VVILVLAIRGVRVSRLLYLPFIAFAAISFRVSVFISILLLLLLLLSLISIYITTSFIIRKPQGIILDL
jgi:hypothetical protein